MQINTRTLLRSSDQPDCVRSDPKYNFDEPFFGPFTSSKDQKFEQLNKAGNWRWKMRY